MSLHVDETGITGNPSIVFLHGIGASGWMWAYQIAALADFHCLNIDLPGHGKSNHIAWVSLAETARAVAAVIAARATNGRSHIVGLSLGGYVALVLMDQHPELLDRVVISGITAEPMPNRALLTPQLMLMSLMKRRWIAGQQARSLGLPRDMQVAFVENFMAMSMRTYARIAREAVVFHLPASLRFSEIPALIVAGGRESRIIRQAVHAAIAVMPAAQGRFAPHMGHGWNVENPGLFNAMLRAWFAGEALPRQLLPPDAGA